jgi:uncharacterized protein
VKLLIFSDIHNDWKALTRLMETPADHYFAAGDMVSWARGLDRCGEILAQKAGQVHILPGNHESTEDIQQLCSKFRLNYFHGKSVELGGFQIAGLGYSNPTPFDTPGEYTEEEMARELSAFSGLEQLILVCHCPPLDTPLDRMRDGGHAGSTAVLSFVEEHQPDYFFCGHVHEAEGVKTTIGRTIAVNVGKRGYLLDLSETAVSL